MSKLFVKLMNQRKKHFARLRAEEKRRKPPTKSQQRNRMCTYLKNMASFTHNQIKNKSFEEVQKAFDKTMSWINSFVPMDSEIVEGSGKKAKSSRKEAKKQKKEDQTKSSETATRPTRGVIMREASETTTRQTIPPQQQLDPKNKGKGKMVEPEKPLKKKD
nr:hypothetical protein [Tanacetum cinerariifolium]